MTLTIDLYPSGIFLAEVFLTDHYCEGDENTAPQSNSDYEILSVEELDENENRTPIDYMHPEWGKIVKEIRNKLS